MPCPDHQEKRYQNHYMMTLKRWPSYQIVRGLTPVRQNGSLEAGRESLTAIGKSGWDKFFLPFPGVYGCLNHLKVTDTRRNDIGTEQTSESSRRRKCIKVITAAILVLLLMLRLLFLILTKLVKYHTCAPMHSSRIQ